MDDSNCNPETWLEDNANAFNEPKNIDKALDFKLFEHVLHTSNATQPTLSEVRDFCSLGSNHIVHNQRVYHLALLKCLVLQEQIDQLRNQIPTTVHNPHQPILGEAQPLTHTAETATTVPPLEPLITSTTVVVYF